jgi:hypothetical protein
VLAISALLYGTSGTYVFADDISGNPDPDALQQFLNDTQENSTTPPPEGTQGFDPAGALPKNVAVDSSSPVNKQTIKMCNPSFTVNGSAMADFPVTVNGNDVGTWSVVGNKAVVTGKGWRLELPVGDTWSAQWKLTVTDPNITVNRILLEPFKRQKPDQEFYAFDLGGKTPNAGNQTSPSIDYEHTPNAARGQFIVQMAPSAPTPIFTATYSRPVYTNRPLSGPNHITQQGNSSDGISIGLGTLYGGTGPDASAKRIPTHDLYGSLEIDFRAGVAGPVLINPGLKFVADTDCLPVQDITNVSYVGTTLSFTVVGEGAVAIMEGQKVVQGPFVVERGDGEGTFTTQFIPTAGACYNMMDVDTLKVMTQNYCF